MSGYQLVKNYYIKWHNSEKTYVGGNRMWEDHKDPGDSVGIEDLPQDREDKRSERQQGMDLRREVLDGVRDFTRKTMQS